MIVNSSKSGSAGQYDIIFVPLIRNQHQLHVSIGTNNIPGSPFIIPVTVPPEVRGAHFNTTCITELNKPTGLAVTDKGLVVVSESFSHCITVLDKKGKVCSFASKGSNKGQLKYPQGLAVTSQGTILIADRNNNRIQEFTMKGKCLSCVGTKGKGPLKFRYPRGIAINRKTGQVFVADTGNNCIQILNPDLSYSRTVEGEFTPHDLTIDSQGSVYVTDFENSRILKFSSDDQQEVKISKLYSSKGGGSESDQLCYPSGISIDSNDMLYVVNSRNQYIMILSSDGHHISSIDRNYENKNWVGTYDGIVFDETSGTVYVACPNKNMLKLF